MNDAPPMESREVGPTMFDSIEGLRAAGFGGFIAGVDLIRSRCLEVPVARGVYMVVRESEKPRAFMPRSTAGAFRGTEATVRVDVLEAKWVPGAIVLYVGEAGGSGVRGQLQQRIKRHLRFAQGATVAAWGGRYLWQLTDSRALKFAWQLCDDPIGEKQRLLAAFARRYEALPFANLPEDHAEES